MRLFAPEDMGADVAVEEPFGPYLVYERLGVGGMATVHRALERGIEGFERIVALKRLLPHLALDATFIKSFVREAKLASVLNHVNIVQIFELGRVSTQYFISMEYIDGRDIRRILRHARKVSGPPPIHVTVGLLLQLCDALDYAHHKVDDAGHPMGLVHRDVSPSNVLVTHAGQVKVIDFGIAKAQSAQLRTQTGRVKGKLAYMAPEALAGKDLDARSDLFAAGVIAHELLTARPLFASKNEYQTLMKVQRGEVMPPSTFNQGCPPELDAIVLRTLARDPDDRFPGASELRDQLHALRKQYGLQTADRDIASWLDWAFQLEVPTEGPNGGPNGGPHGGPNGGPHGSSGGSNGAAGGEPDPRGRKRTARPRRQDDDEAVELAWGGHDEHDNGEPVVLDDVPDVSAKHLQSASALGAEVRLDLDDLADDIPTPLPSHGRPTVDLAARTMTAPQLPRHFARGNPAAARKSRSVPAQHAEEAPPAAAPLPPAPAGDDGKTSIEISPIVPAVRSALVPSRARTITMPPRAAPPTSVAPRTASATLPPRSVPGSATSEPSRSVPLPVAPSRGVPLPAAPSRSVPLPAASEPSRSVPLPAAPSRSGPTAAEPSRGVPVPAAPSRSGPTAAEPSRGVPVPAAPSRSGAVSSGRSRSAPMHAQAAPPRSGSFAAVSPPGSHGADLSHDIPVAIDPPPSYVGPVPSRSAAATMTPPRAVPSASVPPRGRRATSPGTVAPATSLGLGTPSEPVIRDTLLDLSSTDRTPVFRPDELGLAGDTMPAMPAMPTMEATQPSVSVVRFRAPSVPPPNTAASASAPPTAPHSSPAVHSSPAAHSSPTAHSSPAAPTSLPSATTSSEPREPSADAVVTTSTRRQRLITPATALFAEPEPDGSAATAVTTSLHGLPDAPPMPRRRIPLGRVLLVVLGLVLISAATTAAGLYLTRTPDAARIRGPAPLPPPPSKTVGTVHFAVAPADATITITGAAIPGPREHRGSPWNTELPAGGYSIEIDREGYKSWLTSIDVVAGQRQPFTFTLEALGAAVSTEATLVVGPPDGLDITVDGVASGKTPSRLSITAGHHAVALRAGNAEVWRKEIDVRPSAVYEVQPVIPAPSPAAGSPANAAGSSAPAAPPVPGDTPAASAGSSDPTSPTAAPTAPTAPAAEAGAPSTPPVDPAPRAASPPTTP